ncbi:hypothetical protein [Amycolatopsis taiwanensis]|uniref:hypothetical protein n=1 Tax=Amycolatopsis taiwanensis TaxID=342230 RepID=UPI0004851839|nr:hypothetical protein [Amycolatopsis taiwanensis]
MSRFVVGRVICFLAGAMACPCSAIRAASANLPKSSVEIFSNQSLAGPSPVVAAIAWNPVTEP